MGKKTEIVGRVFVTTKREETTDEKHEYAWLEWPRLKVWCRLPRRKPEETTRQLVERWASKSLAGGSRTDFALSEDWRLDLAEEYSSPFMPPRGSRLRAPARLKRQRPQLNV